jgi:hypothetical protein
MSSWAPTKYKTTNWSAYSEALRQRGSLTIRFDPDMVWRTAPTGKRGRQPSFSNSAIQTDLPLNFHPAGTGALWVDTPNGAGGATDRCAEFSGNAARLSVAVNRSSANAWGVW